MKILSEMLLILSSFILCFGINPGICQSEPIVIGSVGDFSGTYSTIGEDQKAGIDLAVEEVNSKGGVIGRKLVVMYEDCSAKPALAATKTEKLILQNKADVIIGAISSGSTLAMMKIAEKHKVLMLAPISESVKITTDEKSRYVFRFPAHVFMTNIALAKWMIHNAGPRLYLLSVDYDWGRMSNEAYKKGAQKFGGQIVGETYFPLRTKDFAPYFGKIKSAHPDGLLITSAGNDAISVLSQLNQYGLMGSIAVGGAGSMVAESNLGALGNNAEGFVTVDYYTPNLDTPQNQRFRELYKGECGRDPSKFSVMCYETILWLAQTIEKAGEVGTESLINDFENSYFQGPQGSKRMDPTSHQARLPVYLIMIKDGKKTLVEKVKY